MMSGGTAAYAFLSGTMLRRRNASSCYAILREPTVWSAIERVAAKLMERGKLSAAEALEAIGGDAAKLRR